MVVLAVVAISSFVIINKVQTDQQDVRSRAATIPKASPTPIKGSSKDTSSKSPTVTLKPPTPTVSTTCSGEYNVKAIVSGIVCDGNSDTEDDFQPGNPKCCKTKAKCSGEYNVTASVPGVICDGNTDTEDDFQPGNPKCCKTKAKPTSTPKLPTATPRPPTSTPRPPTPTSVVCTNGYRKAIVPLVICDGDTSTDDIYQPGNGNCCKSIPHTPTPTAVKKDVAKATLTPTIKKDIVKSTPTPTAIKSGLTKASPTPTAIKSGLTKSSPTPTEHQQQ
ncbi:MAG: seg [Microgenomates group bacterium GW2011_GWC1_39_12]|nr:MAG: seg [Microgenomates group bacterium GW2011_GWC1_39_12]